MNDQEWEKVEQRLNKLSARDQRICWMLAQGYSQVRSGKEGDITQARVSQMLADPLGDFREAVDALRLWLSRKGRAERLRLAWQAIRQKSEGEALDLAGTSLLDWLRYAGKLEGDDPAISHLEVKFTQPKTMAELLAGLDE